jgi:hypothetical protein
VRPRLPVAAPGGRPEIGRSGNAVRVALATMIAKDLTDLMLIEWAMREQGAACKCIDFSLHSRTEID